MFAYYTQVAAQGDRIVAVYSFDQRLRVDQENAISGRL